MIVALIPFIRSTCSVPLRISGHVSSDARRKTLKIIFSSLPDSSKAAALLVISSGSVE